MPFVLCCGCMAGQLPDDLVAGIREVVARRPEIREAYVFGSVARGDAREHSDVDVAVWIDRSVAPTAPYGYEADLGSDLIARLRRNDIDVVLLNEAPPLLYHRVLRDGIRISSRDLRATTVREGQAMSRWCDWAPTQRRIDAVLSARHERGDLGR